VREGDCVAWVWRVRSVGRCGQRMGQRGGANPGAMAMFLLDLMLLRVNHCQLQSDATSSRKLMLS
jgi:hypothetical protein